MRKLIPALVLCIGLAGCLESTEPELIYRWGGATDQGEAGWEHLAFQAAFLWSADQQVLVAGVQVENDEVDAVRTWRLNYETCASGGEILGVTAHYPDLVIQSNGVGTVETGFNAVIDPGDDFHVTFYAGPSDDTLIACVNLVPQST
jgi:hypothetical protein